MPARFATACLTTTLLLFGLGTAPTAAQSAPPGTQLTVRAGDGAPVVAAYVEAGRPRRLYGAAMARGASPQASAEQFLLDRSPMLGIERADVRPVPIAAGEGSSCGLMYDEATGRHRFTVLHFEQARDEVPVYGARLTVLVRNEPTHPVVLANPDVRDLGDFRIEPALRTAPANPAGAAAAIERVRLLNELAGDPAVVSVRRVIWAGLDEAPRPPRLADELEVSPWRGRLARGHRRADRRGAAPRARRLFRESCRKHERQRHRWARRRGLRGRDRGRAPVRPGRDVSERGVHERQRELRDLRADW